jgi:hypothetical protein
MHRPFAKERQVITDATETVKNVIVQAKETVNVTTAAIVVIGLVALAALVIALVK